MIAVSETVQAAEVREQMRKMRAKGWQHDFAVKSVARLRRMTVDRVEELIAHRVRGPRKRKNELRKITGPTPVTREQVLEDYACLDKPDEVPEKPLSHKEKIKGIAAYYGETIARITYLFAWNPEASAKSNKPPYEPDAEEIATRTAALRENWSDHVRAIRSSVRYHYACEIETPVFPGCVDGSQ